MFWYRRIINLSFLIFFLLTGCSVELNERPFIHQSGISGIFHKRCAECHHKEGPAPFPLLTYQDVKSKTNRIRFVLENNIMPPWPADTSYSRFLYEKVISFNEKEELLKWISDGCPIERWGPLRETEAEHIYPAPRPDAIVYPAEPPVIEGNGKDAFLIVKYPYTLSCDTWLDYVRFVPHQKKWVHHVNGHLVHFDEKRKIPDYFKGVPWYREVRDSLKSIYQNMNISYKDGKQPEFPLLTTNTVYYLPGYFPLRFPDWVGGWKLPRHGVFLMNNLHYGPSPQKLTDSSYLEVYFRKSKPQRPIRELQMGTLGISPVVPPLFIPAGTIKTFTTQSVVQQKISLLSVNPHMHLLGKSFKAFAIRPAGDTLPLIHIPKWDFRWQYYYTYPRPVVLEKGTRIVVMATFDNTPENPFNPNRPPKDVSEGTGAESMRTTDEMLQFIFTFVPYEPGDENRSLEVK